MEIQLMFIKNFKFRLIFTQELCYNIINVVVKCQSELLVLG